MSPDYDRQTHVLGSLQSSTDGRSQGQKSRQRYGQKMIQLLGSTLDGTRAKNNRSKMKNDSRQPYDMSVGIKSKVHGAATTNQDLSSVELKPITRSLRKTVTLDMNGSNNEDQLTASVGSGGEGSIEDYEKLNSSVQTTDFLEVVHDISGVTRIETRHPTVIQIIDTQPEGKTESGLKSTLTKERKPSPIENLILGTVDPSGQRFQSLPRAGRGKINQEQAMLDHLLNTCDDEGSEQENQQQSLEMIKLRKVLMTAMQMNKTSMDKKWSQMTPFERTKIKDCFTELLRDLNKQEVRAQRARGVLDSGTSGTQINKLNDCLTS